MKLKHKFSKLVGGIMIISIFMIFFTATAYAADHNTVSYMETSSTCSLNAEPVAHDGTITLAFPSVKYLHTIQHLNSVTYTGYPSTNNEELLWLEFYDKDNNYTYRYSFLLDGKSHDMSVNIEPGTYQISQTYISKGWLKSISLRFYY